MLKPKLRPLDVRPVFQGKQRLLMLRDPLGIASREIFLPAEIGPLLHLMDGTRDARDLSISLSLRFGQHISPADIQQLINVLDRELLLDNDNFRTQQQKILEEFRQAPFRPMNCAGSSYPENPDTLAKTLQNYVEKACSDTPSIPEISPTKKILGLICPHIDFQRGWRVYARVWHQAKQAFINADTVIIIGTDHYGTDESGVTLTYQSYATPWGVLPTHRDAVEYIAHTVGEDTAFAGELRHKGEHSIELAAVWLHFIREGKACHLIPILTGTFQIEKNKDPHTESLINPIVEKTCQVISKIAEDLQAPIVSAADLSHVGPAFGGPPLDLRESARLKDTDARLLEYITRCDATGFFAEICRTQNETHVCGVSAIFTLMRALKSARGTVIDYQRCPADENGLSAVTICGAIFS